MSNSTPAASIRDSFNAYLTDLEVTQTVMTRSKMFLERCQQLLPEDISDFFISETRDQEGNRIWENLWLFSKHFACEAHNFLHEDNVDVATMAGGIRYLALKVTNFSPGNKADVNAKAMLSLVFTNGVTGEIKATGHNCERLNTLFTTLVNTRMPTHDVLQDTPADFSALPTE